jgi:hypothetical protein
MSVGKLSLVLMMLISALPAAGEDRVSRSDGPLLRTSS